MLRVWALPRGSRAACAAAGRPHRGPSTEGVRNTAPAGDGWGWRREKKERKERERKEDKEERNERKEKEGRRETISMGREVRKGQAPPMAVLHGYKYPVGQPKSILKRTENASPPPAQVSGTLSHL